MKAHCGFDLHFPNSEAEHLFMYLLAMCMSPWGEVPVQVLCPFFTWIVCLVLSCMSSLYILGINPLLELLFANIISHSVGCLSVLLTVSFAVQKLFNLI